MANQSKWNTWEFEINQLHAYNNYDRINVNKQTNIEIVKTLEMYSNIVVQLLALFIIYNNN